jgi:hypothetical protein
VLVCRDGLRDNGASMNQRIKAGCLACLTGLVLSAGGCGSSDTGGPGANPDGGATTGQGGASSTGSSSSSSTTSSTDGSATGSGGSGSGVGGSSGNTGGSSGRGGGSTTGAGGSSGGAAGRGAGGSSSGSGGSAGNGGSGGAPLDAGVNGPIAGPLSISSNPHYFQDANGRAILLAGSHTWNDLQDWGTGGTPEPFDFTAYTNFLVSHGQNFTLLWRVELPKFCALPTTDTNPPDITTSPQPWLRTGPGNANDGGLKFDLTKFDPAYFDRLRSRVSQLNAAGIWVGVYLFTGEFLAVYRCTGDGHPLTGANNINSIDDGGGVGSMSMSAPNAITAIEEAMIDKTIDTLNDLPNVLWIVSEEAPNTTMWWQSHMIGHVHSYEATKPHKHPVGLGAINGAADQTLYDSDADWVAPFAKISPSSSCGAGTPMCKVNVNDSDHSYFGLWSDSKQTNRNYVWENFTRGNQIAFMDPYTVYYPRQGRNNCTSPKNGICTGPDTQYDNFRDNFGYVVAYSKKLNLKAAQPSTTLCSTGYCLGQTPAIGAEMLVYAPNGGTFTVDLSKSAGRTMTYEWFDPSSGRVISMGSVSGGTANQSFTTPASITTDSVLYIVDSAGHA